MDLKMQNLLYEMKQRGLDIYSSQIRQEEAALIKDKGFELYNSIPEKSLEQIIKSKQKDTYKDITKRIRFKGSCKEYEINIVLGLSNDPMVRVIFAKEGYDIEEKYPSSEKHHNFCIVILRPHEADLGFDIAEIFKEVKDDRNE